MILRVSLLSSLSLVAVLCCGCGGGGGGGGGTAAPANAGQGNGTGGEPAFGLESRPVVAAFNVPTQIGQPSGFSLGNAFPNLSFSASIFLAGVPGQDRVVVVEQGGRVHAFDNDPAVANTRVVLNLSGVVNFSGEQGLLGWAFDPDFSSNGYVYVHYSNTSPRRSVISRFTWDSGSDLVLPASEKIILELEQPASNHNGGMLAFGSDDYLYIGFGDGGGGGDTYNNGQNPLSLHGNILRIDVHPANAADAYDIPPDNPFVGTPGFREEIWALGLRNPFRFSFDRQNGDLWLGDVGQNQWEEVDLIERGGNYGWPRFEGNQLFDSGTALAAGLSHSAPVTEYDHGAGRAIIGGYVYRGSEFAALFGRYLYTDNSSGTIWALDYAGGSVQANEVIASATAPTSFGEDNQGELYVVSGGGTISRFIQSGGGSLPVTLSATGLFPDLASLEPVSGFIEYEPKVPFWSDGSLKQRWVAIPEGRRVGLSPTGQWGFPLGTVILKHFEIELIEGDPASRKRLETRVLVNGSNEWFGFTYRWNSEGSEAVLLAGRESEILSITTQDGSTRLQQYDYPSRADCLACHNPAAGFALGLVTRQMNGNFDYPAATDNQLRAWNHIDLFDIDIGDSAQYEAYPAMTGAAVDLDSRARAYLAVNCGQCHRPGGPTSVGIDLRFDTPLAAMDIVDEPPQAGTLGIDNARIVAPGSRETSVLWQRMNTLDDGQRMPPLASHRVDTAGVDLIGEWIDQL